MADDIPRKQLWDETTCSLCLDFFTNPVVLDCGHNFCKECILRCWGKPPTLVCPQCQATVYRKILWPNSQLRNIVDIAQQLNDQAMKEAEVLGDCERHQVPLKFFCKDDKVPLCVLCKKLERHKEHHVLLVEAAAEEYKVQFNTCLDNLRKMQEELLKSKMVIEVDNEHLLDIKGVLEKNLRKMKIELLESKKNIKKQSQDMIDATETERQRIVAAFKNIRQFLEDKEKNLLAEMEEVDQEMAMRRDDSIVKVSKELASLEHTIAELKEKCGKPSGDLLEDITSMLQGREEKWEEKIKIPVPFPPTLKWRVWEFWDVGPVLEKVMKKFRETMKSESLHNKEKLTLDQKTAHPYLVISEDGKCLTCGDNWQNMSKSSQRFINYQGVLGSMFFQSGRHCWEVDVLQDDGWAVGVSVLPSQCDKDEPLGPRVGLWAIGKWNGQYRAMIPPDGPVLHLSGKLTRIRVSLNYMGYRVAFFDADTAELLYTFSIPAHRYSAYYPFFGVWSNSCLILGS